MAITIKKIGEKKLNGSSLSFTDWIKKIKQSVRIITEPKALKIELK
jgi:hypothetical protein